MKVLHDLFPAYITVVPPNVVSVEDLPAVMVSPSSPYIASGAKYLERVRIVILQNDNAEKIVLVAADHHSGPRMIFRDKISTLIWSGNKVHDSQLMTVSNKVIAFKHVKSCNCGSRLRSWSPYVTMDSIKDPTE